MELLLFLLWNEQTNQAAKLRKQQEQEAQKPDLRAAILASMPPIPVDKEEQEQLVAMRDAYARANAYHERIRERLLIVWGAALAVAMLLYTLFRF